MREPHGIRRQWGAGRLLHLECLVQNAVYAFVVPSETISIFGRLHRTMGKMSQPEHDSTLLEAGVSRAQMPCLPYVLESR